MFYKGMFVQLSRATVCIVEKVYVVYSDTFLKDILRFGRAAVKLAQKKTKFLQPKWLTGKLCWKI